MHIEKMTDVIETKRLVLFPYTEENLALFNTDLSRFEEEYGVVYRGEELDHLLTGFLKKLEIEIAEDREHYLFFTEFLIVLKENSHIIGSIDFKYVPRDGVTEVGYGMNPAYTGRGYMTEALKAFLDFGKRLGVKIVRADTLKDNIKSQNVLKRCGFAYLYDDGNLWWEKILYEERNTEMEEQTITITVKTSGEKCEMRDEEIVEWYKTNIAKLFDPAYGTPEIDVKLERKEY